MTTTRIVGSSRNGRSLRACGRPFPDGRSPRAWGRWSYAAWTGVALLVAPAAARAQQLDTNPPLPNVLLMIDNSGSMERMIDGSFPEASSANTCNCVDTGAGSIQCNWGTTPVANRWNTVQTALTGTLQNGFNCVAMARSPGSTFAQEYQIGGNAPYDVGYYLPFHRIVAKDTTATPAAACVMAPGSLPGAPSTDGVGPLVVGSGAGGNATDFPPSAIIARQYGQLTPPPNYKNCTFAQNNNGAVGSTTTLMRYGMMTFDTDPSAGIGVSSGSNPQVVNPAFSGMWSYFPGWNSGGSPTSVGLLPNCSTPNLMAVGARNPAAPPWEGRLVYFPTTNDLTAQTNNNNSIQQVILATRPYGGTPIAGMFTGAQYFFWSDPQGPQQTDGFVKYGCRPEYIILVTDGAPNLDLQPQCSQVATSGDGGSATGQCPFPLPQTTAATLYNNGQVSGTNQFVTTYVIGFAVSSFQDQGTLVKCSEFAQNQALASQCDCSNPALAQGATGFGACCELQCIARAGGSGQAYFADTQGDLANALNSILSNIAKNTTTRTTPAFSPVVTNVVADPNNPTTNSSVYLASFNPSPPAPVGGSLFSPVPWSGDIQRQRSVCTYQGSGYTVPAPSVDKTKGDDFATNLNSNSGPQRTFIAFAPDTEADGKTVDSSATIRPYVSAMVGDGLGKYSATTYSGQAAGVTASIPSAAFGPSIATGCQYTSTTNGAATTMATDLCRTMLLDYLFAQQSFTSGLSDFAFVSRYGNALGDIYHATPTVVGPPGSLLQDPLYVGFRQKWQSRDQIVYASTNDGLLHAFWADETKAENNERWAMVPPAVLSNLYYSYPSSHLFLLDGPPITKDVVWDRNNTTTDPAVWHSMLVAGYGSYYPGYYAVDVTNPDASHLGNGVVPTDPAPPGPVFMWQLSKLPSSTYQVFGKYSARPAITTLFVDPGDGKGAREIGVALLPGGKDSGPTSTTTSCARTPKSTDSAPPGDWTARSAVRCWGANQKTADPVNGRALAVVRLDTGEILRVFTRAADVPSTDPLAIKQRINDTPLDSPMTGTPIPFPVDVGTDATKVFVGDEDGTIWRFDVSNSDPTKWTGELFLDLYNTKVDTNTTSWNEGQPLQVDPVMSLDTAANVVLNVATGTTDQYDTNGIDVIYSVTEKVQGSPAKLRAAVNWWLGPKATGISGSGVLDQGERVSGPMTVFNSTFYFATYDAGASNTNACKQGMGRIWGRDFVTPADTNDLSLGGVRELQPPLPAAPQSPPPPYIQPSDYDSTILGAVIPGVSIKATPACAGLGTPGSDQYVAGATHSSPQNFAPGSYSLFTQVGKTGTNGSATAQIQMPVQTPTSPTTIDSWAAVLE
jgi:type IV pilus assembly protein PilY1